MVELFSFPETPPRATYPEACGLRHPAFEVDDIDGARKELENKKVKITKITTDPHTGKRMLFFFDPDDLPLELYEA